MSCHFSSQCPWSLFRVKRGVDNRGSISAQTMVVLLLLPLLPRPGIAAPLPKADQLCIVASHKAAAKLLSTIHKENLTCLKMGTKGKLPDGVGVNACLQNDLKGKVASAVASLDTVQNGPAGKPTKAKCPTPRPSVGFVEASAFESDLREIGYDWAWSTSGATGRDLASILLGGANDPAQKKKAVCQQSVIKAANKIVDQGLKQYLVCVKSQLKVWDGSDTDPLSTCIQSAVVDDVGGRIEQARAGLEKLLDKKCTSVGVSPVSAVPSYCARVSGDDGALSACVARNARRALLRVAAAVGGVEAELDEAFSHVTATSTVYLGRLIGYGSDMALASAPAAARADGAAGDKIWGTDVGIPVSLTVNNEERTYFLFGDTDYSDPSQFALGQIVKQEPGGDPYVLDNGVNQGDVIGYSTDANPDDGISMTRVLRNIEDQGAPVCSQLDDADDLRALAVPGVHDDPSNYFYEDTSGITGSFCLGAALNATPTGAWAVGSVLYSVTAVQNSFVDSAKPDEAFLAFSTDNALTWQLMNGGNPISGTTAGPSAKFIHIETLAVDAAELQDPIRSAPCPLPEPPSGNSDALLLFGTGKWRTGGAYLGLVFIDDLETARANPSQAVRLFYYAGAPSCWVEGDEEAAVVVLDAGAGTNYSHFESACDYRVFDQSGSFGYVSVTRLQGTVGGNAIDRLLMTANPGYATCTTASSCCGGTVHPTDSNLCEFPADLQQVTDSGLGPIVLTGDPYRPWRWSQRTDGSLDFTLVAQDPGTSVGPGPNCRSQVPYTHVLGGYAPLFLDRFTRLNSAGDGFDVYLNSSVGRDEGYNVDLNRFTVREAP